MKGLVLALALIFGSLATPTIAHAQSSEGGINDLHPMVYVSIGLIVACIAVVVFVANSDNNQYAQNAPVLLDQPAFVRNTKLFLLDEWLFRFTQHEQLLLAAFKQ